MTTIAFDGTHIAADRLMGGWHTAGKIFPLAGGRYLAGAGDYNHIVEVATWIAQGAREEARPRLPEEQDTEIMMVEPDGSAYWLTWPHMRWVKYNEPFAALGTGSEYALGAMAMGASAKKAVSIAMRFDPYTGKGITCLKVVK